MRRGIYAPPEPRVARDGAHAKRVYFVALLEVLVLAIVRRSVFLLGLLALGACDDDPVSPLGLVAAKARWERANIDSYEMTVRRLCFCGFIAPVRVTVSRGAIVSRANVETGEPVPANVASLYPDVPGLFAIANEARTNADGFNVEYHLTYGFPTAIVIDWRTNAADDEVTYYVEDFAVRLE